LEHILTILLHCHTLRHNPARHQFATARRRIRI